MRPDATLPADINVLGKTEAAAILPDLFAENVRVEEPIVADAPVETEEAQ